ncbi:zinc-binding dehydrogenase [Brevundimonas sp.]|uniref:zinc-binding dehydrogenase n=1 Tax=Brevundimonas sp. TaxID=1871086 RepID=UPI003AFFF868
MGLGADHVIDYKTERFEDTAVDIDLVFDAVGGEMRERSWVVLTRGGVLITTRDEPDQHLAKVHGIRAERFTATSNGQDLSALAAMVSLGGLKPHVCATYVLEKVGEAQERLNAGGLIGKVVLNLISDPPGVRSR